MVEDRIVDGYRIAELLASEVDGRQSGPLAPLAVANADRSVEGSPAGERAYEVRRLAGERDPRREPTPDDAGTLVAEVFVHEEGARVELRAGATAAAGTARELELRVEDEATIRVDFGYQVKRAADALAAASEHLEGEADE